MGSRALRAAMAVGALAAAAHAARIVHAESAFRDGLALSARPDDDPSADLPGRLEAYDEARRRLPGEATYALRAAQVRLRRAESAAPRERLVAEARERFADAARSAPFDPRPRFGLAQAAAAEGRGDDALREAALAVRLGPNSAATWRSGELALTVWRATQSPVALRAAMEFLASAERLAGAHAARTLERALSASGPGVAARVVEAAAGEPRLVAFAARALARSDPRAAEVLAEEARRAARPSERTR